MIDRFRKVFKNSREKGIFTSNTPNFGEMASVDDIMLIGLAKRQQNKEGKEKEDKTRARKEKEQIKRKKNINKISNLLQKINLIKILGSKKVLLLHK
jgi:hypothetical protein